MNRNPKSTSIFTNAPINSKFGNYMEPHEYDNAEKRFKKVKTVVNLKEKKKMKKVKEDTSNKPERSEDRKEDIKISDLDVQTFKNMSKDISRLSNVTSELVRDIESNDAGNYDELVQTLKRSFEPMVVTMQRLPDSKTDLGKGSEDSNSVDIKNSDKLTAEDPMKEPDKSLGAQMPGRETELDKADKQKDAERLGQDNLEDDEKDMQKNRLSEVRKKHIHSEKVAMQTKKGRVVWVLRNQVSKYIAKGYKLASGVEPRGKKKRKTIKPKRQHKTFGKLSEIAGQLSDAMSSLLHSMQSSLKPELYKELENKMIQQKFTERVRDIKIPAQIMFAFENFIRKNFYNDKEKFIRITKSLENAEKRISSTFFAQPMKELYTGSGTHNIMPTDKQELIDQNNPQDFNKPDVYNSAITARQKELKMYQDLIGKETNPSVRKYYQSRLEAIKQNIQKATDYFQKNIEKTGSQISSIQPKVVEEDKYNQRVIMRAPNKKTYAVRSKSVQKYLDKGFRLERDTQSQMPKVLKVNESRIINNFNNEIDNILKEVIKIEKRILKKK